MKDRGGEESVNIAGRKKRQKKQTWPNLV